MNPNYVNVAYGGKKKKKKDNTEYRVNQNEFIKTYMTSFYGIVGPIQMIYSSGQCIYPKNSTFTFDQFNAAA